MEACEGTDMAESMDQLLNAEFKEAFDEFDKVGRICVKWLKLI